MKDPANSGGMCCHTLFELPSQVGSMPAGTLLWEASFGADVPTNRWMTQRVWKSLDGGRTWSFLSVMHTANSTLGVWEPEFTVAADGQLVVFVSDETDPAHSQKLIQLRSRDGVTWTDKTDVVSLAHQPLRPGMANMRRLPSGKWIMSYEVWSMDGSSQGVVHTRLSSGGWNWGDPASIGRPVRTASGKYASGKPTLTVAGNTVLVNAAWIRKPDNTVSPDTGNTLLGNAAEGGGNWFEVSSPVPINDSIKPNSVGVTCPGYSNPLLASVDGKSVMQLSNTWNAQEVCQVWVWSGANAPRGGASATEVGQAYTTPTPYQEHYFFRGGAAEARHIFWDSSVSQLRRDTWATGIAGTPSTFVYQTQQHLFARSSLGELRHSFWDSRDGVLRSEVWGTGLAADPSLLLVGTAQHAWAVDTAGALNHWWFTPGIGITSDTWVGSGVAGRPSVLLEGDQQHAVVRTTAGQLEHRWWNPYQGMRSERFGSGVAGDPATAQIGDAFHVWAVDTAGALKHWWWTPDWGWFQDTWATGVTGRPALIIQGMDQHVFIRSTTNELRHIVWTPTGGFVNEVWGSNVASDPGVLNASGLQHVWAQDTTGTTHHWWKNATSGVLQNDWGK